MLLVKKGKALILFFKYPEKGVVKTRLANKLGDDFTFELYKRFIADILETSKNVDAEIFVAGSTTAGINNEDIYWRKEYTCFLQEGADIGMRMYNAFCEVGGRGYQDLVLIGGDTPDLPAAYIDEAFQRVDEYDMVLGPTVDGGYYLIAFDNEALDHEIFIDIAWSTSRVMDQTLDRAEKTGKTYFLLPTLRDVDEVDDLRRFYERHKMKKKRFHTMDFLSRKEEYFYR
jgi:rSAM/selenodomain-associated transferase 1